MVPGPALAVDAPHRLRLSALLVLSDSEADRQRTLVLEALLHNDTTQDSILYCHSALETEDKSHWARRCDLPI